MKAILEFPAPESCAECKLLYRVYTQICGALYSCIITGNRVLAGGKERDPFCPLKIAPEGKNDKQ